MRKFLTVCALALMTASGAVAQDKTTLRWMTIFDADQSKDWAPVVEAFEMANPDITVKMESVAGSGAAVYPDVLRTSMASGDPADVFFMWGGEIAAPFVRAEQVRSVDDLYETYPAWNDRFAKWVIDRLQYEGASYGIPYRARGMGFWYRSDIFASLGISPPETYADLEAACVTLKEAGIHCASFGGKFGWHIMRLLDFFVEKECGNDIHDAIYALEGSFDQPCMVAAYGLLKKWVDEEWLVPDFLNVSPNDARIPVFTGQAASIIEGGWLEGALIAAEQDLSNYDIFLPPTDQTPKRYPAFPEQWMIPAAAKNVEAAGKFVDFITSPETQNAFPTPFGGTATIGYNNDCEKMPHDCTWAGILGSDRETYLLTDQAYTKELADGFFEVQADVISGRLSPEDAAKAMQKKAADYTAKNPK